MFSFNLIAKEGDARAGRLITPHGSIETPSFVAVGTQAAVKGVSEDDLKEIGTQIIIANAYHLHLQPGEETIEKMGGLHSFMNWNGPLMTDSGGFQIFNLGAAKEHGVGKIASIFPDEQNRGGHFSSKKRKSLIKVGEDGVEFISYLDGSKHRFVPEGVIDIERRLGADIILVLDECTSPLHDYKYTRNAMKRTHNWAARAFEKFKSISNSPQALFGVVQGGAHKDLREKSASFIGNMGFDGYAIGGSLGRSKDDMHQVLEWTTPLLPYDKPRHLLGIGEIEDIFEVVARGIDMFDCIAPTLMARTGTLFVKSAKRFRIHILNSKFKDDSGSIEEWCNCYTCCNYSRAYLRHLFQSKELLAVQLAAIHNLSFVESLMYQIRTAIKEGHFAILRDDWLSSNGENFS